MAKGVAHAGKGKSLSSGEARENERRGWTEDSYRRKNEKNWNNYDWSRHGLNFEIKDGRIIPLGSQSVSLYNRYQSLIKSLDFKEYKAGATNKQHTYVELILSGSTEKMKKIAFGDQNVSFERNPEQWQNWDVNRTTGTGSIEEWAMDVYNFVSKKYGNENIIGFEVHLDETEPHVHVNIVPTAIKKQRGNVSGYHKIVMENGQPKLENGKTIPVTYTKGKHVGEVIKISDKKYEELSDEKKLEYRKNERGTVRTISYATYFGDKLEERSEKLSELHDDFYKEVGMKWGFERGDVIANLPLDEQWKRKHLTKFQRWRLNQAETAQRKAEKDMKDANDDRDVAVKEKNEAVEEKEKAEKEKASVQKDIDAMKAVTTLPFKNVESYVKALSDIEFIVSKEVRAKLKSPLKNHPRVCIVNPPLTVFELEKISTEAIDKIYENAGVLTSKGEMLKQIKAILTDKQTILFDVVGEKQKKGIIDANRELYKAEQKRLAVEVEKAVKYNEMERAGINKTSYENAVRDRDEAKRTADRMPETERMLEFAWPGITRAKNVLVDPALDENYMTDEQKKAVLSVLRKDPKNRLDDITRLISYACSFRDIPLTTRAEAIELAAESVVKFVAEQGCDLIKEAASVIDSVAKELEMTVEEAATSAASAAVCLIFGYLDAANTVSQGCGGGGGGNNDLPKKMDDEDNRRFYGRCLNAVVGMMKPRRQMSQGRRF